MSIANDQAKRIFKIAGVAAVFYLIGFFVFALSMKTANPAGKTDAIIALTGDSARIAAGVRDIAQGRSDRLFISGIQTSNEPRLAEVISSTLAKMRREGRLKLSEAAVMSKIARPGNATDTLGNGLESREWCRKNNIKSVRLVTSFYHMPRAKFVFSRMIPDVKIVAESIPAMGKSSAFSNLRLLKLGASEYNKLVATYIWSLADFAWMRMK
ncbi:MAG: YdcF family protein [Rickettsiales bacterium]|jgi:uncharacterized SAM-binding protein YcdF (DUF218 family)|nr:YdcF family protein [Rickettsiales bacterium]